MHSLQLGSGSEGSALLARFAFGWREPWFGSSGRGLPGLGKETPFFFVQGLVRLVITVRVGFAMVKV